MPRESSRYAKIFSYLQPNRSLPIFYLKFDGCAVVDDRWWCHVAMLRRHSHVGVRCHGWGFHHRYHGDVDIVPHHERDRESRKGEHIEHNPCRHHVWKREHVL